MHQLGAEQYEVRFRTDDGKQYRADRARDLVGFLLDGDQSPEVLRLFHRHPDGRVRSDQPCIRFRGGNGFFGIIAVGEEAADTVVSLESRIRRALSAHLGRPLRTEALTSVASLRLSDRIRCYRSHLLVFANKHKKMHTLFDLTDQELVPHLQNLILQGIQRQAEQLNLDLPAESILLHVAAIGRRGRIPLGSEKAKVYAGYASSVDFISTLDLRGHWAAGGLKNCGYGSIRTLPAAEAKLIREHLELEPRHAKL